MDAFATTEQYDARFPGRTASDEMLEECLADATAAIVAALEPHGVDFDDVSEGYKDKLMRVCRQVANRIMPSGSDIPAGATQMSTTAGPYQQTFSLPAVYGSPKLLPSELSMLGLGGGRVGWARLGGGCHD